MSSKYNRYLLSTCLPLMSIAVCMPSIVNAGFEWTPPEKVIAPVEVVPVPDMDIPAPVAPAPVVSEVIDDKSPDVAVAEVEEEASAPAIEIIVIDDSEEMAATITEHEEEVADEVVEKSVPEDDAEVIVIKDEVIKTPENASMEVSEEVVVVDDAPLEVDIAVEDSPENENIVVEVVDIEEDKVSAPVKKGGSLVLNPYPLKEVEVKQEKETIIWNTPESFEVIDGFGSNMPLALALRQIVPAKYAFSFGAGVNPGVRISWQGGKPWNEVLSDALAAAGIKAVISNKKVLLSVDPDFKGNKTASKDTEHNTSHDDQTLVSKDDSEVVKPDPDSDIVIGDKDDVGALSISNEQVKEDVGDDASYSYDDGMNDALREVYGDSLKSSEDSNAEDSENLQIDSNNIDSNNNELEEIEELADPIRIVEEDSVVAPEMPDMDGGNSEDNNVKETIIDRNNILDPGESEAIQPNISEEDGLLIEQKKN